MLCLDDFSALFTNIDPVETDILDPRFETIASLAEQEKFLDTIPLIEKLLSEKHRDIRLITYLFYARFLEEGIKGLKHILPNLISLLQEHWEVITPKQNRDKQVYSSLNWFFTTVSKKLRRSERSYKEKDPDEWWNQSVPTLTSQDIEEIKSFTPQLKEAFFQKWENPSFMQSLLFINKWMDDLKWIIPTQETEETPVPVEENPTPAQPPATKEEPLAKPLQPPSEDPIFYSQEMKLLMKKLQTFEKFIHQEEFTKAALVADDISTTISNFNPALFFPKLFSRYFALTAKNINRLLDEWDSKTSPQWNSLSKLYQTDLDEFIKW